MSQERENSDVQLCSRDSTNILPGCGMSLSARPSKFGVLRRVDGVVILGNSSQIGFELPLWPQIHAAMGSKWCVEQRVRIVS